MRPDPPAPMGNFIFNFTPTGMIPTKAMTPHVPVTADEVVRDVVEAVDLGVNMVHLHARDPGSGEPAYQKEVYAETIRGIRAACKEVVVTVSTSGRNWPEFEKRADVLDLEGDAKPDFASLTLSSLNFNNQASVNSPEIIKRLAAKMQERGVRPELEVFDLGMINYAHYLIRKGFITPPYYFNLILGNIACAQADLVNLGLMIRDLPEGSVWSAGGVGRSQLKMNATALLWGGGVRVGLEDNIWFDEARTELASNRALLERVAATAGQLGLAPYSCREARTVLGLS